MITFSRRVFTKQSPCRHKPITSPRGTRTSTMEQLQGIIHPETVKKTHSHHCAAVSLQLSLSRKRMRFVKKRRFLCIRRLIYPQPCLSAGFPPACHGCTQRAARRFALWKRRVSHSFSAASHFIIPAGCLRSCVIEAWFLFMYSSPPGGGLPPHPRAQLKKKKKKKTQFPADVRLCSLCAFRGKGLKRLQIAYRKSPRMKTNECVFFFLQCRCKTQRTRNFSIPTSESEARPTSEGQRGLK